MRISEECGGIRKICFPRKKVVKDLIGLRPIRSSTKILPHIQILVMCIIKKNRLRTTEAVFLYAVYISYSANNPREITIF